MKPMTTGTGIAVALAVAVAVGFMFLGSSLFAPLDTSTQSTDSMNDMNQGGGEVESMGTGEAAKPGDRVTVSYVGRFQDGTVFDASANHGGSFSFTLGKGEVIPGWDQGVVGMRVGGKKTLVVPPELGYGPNDYGPIPGGSTLIFDIELLAIEPTN